MKWGMAGLIAGKRGVEVGRGGELHIRGGGARRQAKSIKDKPKRENGGKEKMVVKREWW